MDNCLFCRIVAGEIPAKTVHETDTTLAFRDVDPKAPVHVLVIPKAHHADVASLALADHQPLIEHSINRLAQLAEAGVFGRGDARLGHPHLGGDDDLVGS